MTYKVFVDDNFHYMDENERHVSGEFETLDEAVAHCRRIVEEQIERFLSQGTSEEQLYDQYTSFGEDPWVKGGNFSAWSYAKEFCDGLCAKNKSTGPYQPK